MKTYKLEVHGTSADGKKVEIVRHLECGSRHDARVICYDLIVIENLERASFQVDGQPEGSHWISVGHSRYGNSARSKTRNIRVLNRMLARLPAVIESNTDNEQWASLRENLTQVSDAIERVRHDLGLKLDKPNVQV